MDAAVERSSEVPRPVDSSRATVAMLSQGLIDFASPQGRDLLGRCEPFGEWVNSSRAAGLLPFIRRHTGAPGLTAEVVDFGGHRYTGINLASQDYLGLATHPDVVRACVQATELSGTHSAGSEPMGGGLRETAALEQELGAFLGKRHVVLFPTGWAAGYGVLRALVRPGDQVVVDALAHNCLQHGAAASTPSVHAFRHNDLSSLERSLRRARGRQPDGAVVVVTESLFSMDSDHPDFGAMQALCHTYGASLCVDAAHDLGVLGPGGRGVLAEQGATDSTDLIVGSFSKTFACIGGYAATNSEAASFYIRAFSGSYTFSNAMIPGQLSAVREALRIVRSPEGNRLRMTALQRASRLRLALASSGLGVSGRLSPIVLPVIGPEPIARLAQRHCLERGVIVNAVEYPACRRGEARFRLQVSPGHTDDGLANAAAVIAQSVDWARHYVGRLSATATHTEVEA